MENVLTVIHVVASLFLVVCILLQSGEGSGLAAGLGGASAGTEVFGGAGAGGFLSKATIGLAGVFMATTLSLAFLSSRPQSSMSLEGEDAATGSQADEIVTPDDVSGTQSEPPSNLQQQGGSSTPANPTDQSNGAAKPGEVPDGATGQPDKAADPAAAPDLDRGAPSGEESQPPAGQPGAQPAAPDGSQNTADTPADPGESPASDGAPNAP